MTYEPVKTIKINEADVDLIEKNLIEYLNSNTSPFKNYNFTTGALSGLIRTAKFLIRNLSYQLNKTVEELYLDTALLEDSIYSLIKNFNYIPLLKRPAKKYLKVVYDITGAQYTPLTNSTFKIQLNEIKYNDTANLIPTMRDKWQSDKYLNTNITDFIGENMFYYYMDKKYNYVSGIGGSVIETNPYLEATMPIYQASWKYNEIVVGGGFTQKVELLDGSAYWGDKVIPETIRVFVKENATTWKEYENMRTGYFDENERAYNTTFDKTKGITVEFDIDHICRTLLVGETVRVIYCVTEGESINDQQGTQTFDNQDFWDINIYEIKTDYTQKLIFSSASNNGSAPFVVTPIGKESYFSATLVDSFDNLTYMDNGLEKQTTDSIKKTAPLFFVTQGRAVTENDYNYLLKTKFVEYKDIKAWGGQREFFDVTQLLTDSINSNLTYSSGKYSGTYDQIFQTLSDVLLNFYSEGILTIDDVSYSNISDGKFRPDVGFVYYSFFDDKWQFVNSSENTEEIIQFLDKYKILTIFHKYMNPMFMFVKPTIKITSNSSYSKSFNQSEMKTNIYNWINSNVGFNSSIDLKELNSYLLTFDSVKAIDEISYSIKCKIKNVSDYENDYIYCRMFSRLDSEIDCELKAYVSDVYSTIGTIKTENGIVKLNGTSITGNKANNRLGLLRFKNWSGTAPFFTNSEFYIDDIKLAGFKLNGIRENVVGCEKIEDITLIVE